VTGGVYITCATIVRLPCSTGVSTLSTSGTND